MEDHDRLKRAWNSLVQHIRNREEGQGAHEIARYRATLSLIIGCSKQTFDKWILNEKLVLGKSIDDRHSQGILDAYRSLARHTSQEWRLAAAVSDSLHLESPDYRVMEKYRGSYIFIRLGHEGPIFGDVLIDNDDGGRPWVHEHRSTQVIDGEDRTFEHSGPVFPVGERLYMLGVGASETEMYFRTLIVRGSDRPHANVLRGVVLTETDETYMPFAAGCVLISRKHRKSKNKEFLKKTVDSIEKYGRQIKISEN